MASTTMTREEIIELINDYIYTNGFQRITAAQLNEVLIEMANSFAMEGGASSGLDAVLAVGSAVSEGREITNEEGGSLKLAAEITLFETLFKYVGMNNQDGVKEGGAYVGKEMSVFGNRLIPMDEDAPPPAPGTESEIKQAFTLYNIAEIIPEDVEEATPRESAAAAPKEDAIPLGITSIVSTNLSNFIQSISPRGIALNVETRGDLSDSSTDSRLTLSDKMVSMGISLKNEYTQINVQLNQLETTVASDEKSTSFKQDQFEISSNVFNGPQSSNHVQSIKGFNWNIQESFIMSVDTDGLTLAEGRKLMLTSGGEMPTCGKATLVGGSATVPTAAVNANSVISLTVQETGTFVGNIRVSAKTPLTGFVISSTQDTDTCEVFWQIIDL